MIRRLNGIVLSVFLFSCSAAQSQEAGMMAQDGAVPNILSPDAVGQAADSAIGQWTVPNPSYLTPEPDAWYNGPKNEMIDWSQIYQNSAIDGSRIGTLDTLNQQERQELEELTSRFDELSESENERLQELQSKGVTVPIVVIPNRPPLVITSPRPERCEDGTTLPAYCRYITSEDCTCP